LEQKAIKTVTWMQLGLDTSTLGHAVKLNRQLMYEKDNIIYPITPMVPRVLLNHWGLDIVQTSFEASIQTIFSAPISQFSNDVKGRALEKYILAQIEKNKFFSCTIAKIDLKNDEKDKWKTIDLVFKNLAIVPYYGNGLPGKVDWTTATVFIPQSTNYPNIDMMLWDPAKALLVAVQITNVDPISKHKNKFYKINDKGKPADMWQNKCKDCKEMWFLWIGTNLNVSNAMKNDYITTIDSLDKSQFPLLQYLKCAEN
jgi:hypothetical protein